MKIHIDKKYWQIGLTIFLTAIAILCVVFFIWNNASIKSSLATLNTALAPVLYGLIIAYLLTPILNFFENKVYVPLFHKWKWFESEKDKKRGKHIRSFSLVTTIIIVIFLIYLFFASVIPQLIESVQQIIKMYPKYSTNLQNWLNQTMTNNPDLKLFISDMMDNVSTETDDWLNDSLLPAITKLIPNFQEILSSLSSSVVKFVKFIWNLVIGLIISIYVLNQKERFAQSCVRLCYAVFERKTANKFIEGVRFTHHTFTGFLSGKVLDSFIIGVICFIVMSIMRMPYTILISVIIGITNIIPCFGPWFGAIPSVLILLMVNPKYALTFIIFIVILQQFDGNFLGPLILSQTTGVTTFWIITSITIFSGLMGVLGMIIAVPVTGCVFALIDNLTNGWLMKKNLPTESENYLSIGPIDEEGNFTHYEYVSNTQKSKDTKLAIGIKKIYLNSKFYFENRKMRRKEKKALEEQNKK